MRKKKYRSVCILLLTACLFGLGGCNGFEKDPFADATDITLMSFNIRIGEQTEARRTAVVQNIRDVDPDVFGVQEADLDWISYLMKNFRDYSVVGEGGDGGRKGEYTAIFYRTEAYTLLQSGTKWLSLTPNTPSRLEGSSEYKRICTYAKLQDNATGAVFVYLNAHLDYALERDAIAGMQLDIVTEYAKNFEGCPVFIAGDFNQAPDSKTYATVAGAGYADAALVAEETHNVPTFHGYGKSKDPQRIDYCFITEDSIRLSQYDTWDKLADNGGHEGYISDHYAIYVKGRFINTADVTAEHALNSTIFQCGNKLYGDVSFNTHMESGISCRYADDTLTFTVDAGKELVLSGLKTAEQISVYITGEGSVILDGDVSAYAFKTADTVHVTVNGAIFAETTELGSETVVTEKAA